MVPAVGDYVHARSRSMQTVVANCSHGLGRPESTAWTLILVFGDNRKLSTQSAEGSKAAELQGTSPCFSHQNSLEEKFNVFNIIGEHKFTKSLFLK